MEKALYRAAKTEGSGHDGFSLISVVMAIAILAILSFYLMNFTRQTLASVTQVRQKGEMEDLRRLVRLRLDCPASIAQAESRCVGNKALYEHSIVALDLKDKSGKEFFRSSAAVQLGGFFLRAVCHDQKVFRIESSRDSKTWQGLYQQLTPCQGVL